MPPAIRGVFGAASRLLAAFGLALLLASCSAPSDSSGTLHTSKGDFVFRLEIADTAEQQQQGLMYRTSLAPDAGMLFDYHGERAVAFWMHNTFIPLDMIFIGADGIVKNIHVNARPQDDTAIPSGVPVRFVLEIAGGRSVEIGLKAGDRFEHIRVKPAS